MHQTSVVLDAVAAEGILGWGGKPTEDPIIPNSISRAVPECAVGGGVPTVKKATAFDQLLGPHVRASHMLCKTVHPRSLRVYKIRARDPTSEQVWATYNKHCFSSALKFLDFDSRYIKINGYK